MWVSKTADRLPIKSWCDDIESKAMQQALNLASLPFAFKHIALMPDCHSGYGMPIGGVLACKDVIIPYAVGNDIGCGMLAVKTNLPADLATQRDLWEKIRQMVRLEIPMGKNHRVAAVPESLMPPLKYFSAPDAGILTPDAFLSARKQMGTLGGGNHFIEFQTGSDRHIWVMLHSGSRNVGLRVCQFHHKVAQDLNEKWNASVPSSWQLAFLPLDTAEGQAYLQEMQWCIAFAEANRTLMMDIILRILGITIPDFKRNRTISSTHNFARKEEYFGQSVWVHRKGATPAGMFQACIIPGSQGTKSYICEGLGNPQSFQSCSHGAGRIMSRSRAKDELDLAEEQRKMEGILHDMNDRSCLDEASGAYKDIESVMKQQEDLVKPTVELTPFAVLKAKGGKRK